MDSSSLVKLYVDEEGSAATRVHVATADRLASNIIAYAEVRAALAAARRGRRIRTEPALRARKADFEQDWSQFYWILPSEQIIRQAAEFAEAHSLSGFDSIHLVSALRLRGNTREAVELSTWDRRLSVAARAEGMSLAHEVTS